jgi:putative spermidine/putrescine transport system ATP-binding protein/spermidine/putrescine transport system ATP-binding protein
MTKIIELRNLSKTFAGDVRAVDGVSLDIEAGEFVTLLGPSGCGKTTMLRLIAGFETPDSGEIVLNGRDVTDDPPYRRPVNTVFQDYALFPHMTVAQNVGYGLRLAGMPKTEVRKRVADALRMVDLLAKEDSLPGQLSGGQRQRVALARAIIRQPTVLLLDEPLSALDVKLREAMQVELKHLHQRLGITFVLVTHDQKEALVMSDRVVVLERGRIAQSGTPGDLYDRPASPYVADFIGTSNLIPATVNAASGGQVEAQVGPHRLRAAASLRVAAGDKVLLSIRPERALMLANGASAPVGCNLLLATVREYLFHGNAMRVELDIGQPSAFLVDLQLRAALSGTDLAKPGSAVRIAIEPVNVTVFPAEPAA